MKALIKEINYTEIEVHSPFFAKATEDKKTYFVKFTDNRFSQIIINDNGTIEMVSYPYVGAVSESWYFNRCEETEWNEAIKTAQNYLKKM